MIKNVLRATVAIALFATAPSIVAAKSALELSGNDLASYCDQHSVSGDADALLDVGGGKSVSITIHCNDAGMNVSSNVDQESESGPSEAAENGVED